MLPSPQNNTGTGDSLALDQSHGEMADESFMDDDDDDEDDEEEEEELEGGQDVLQLDYDFEDDINEELDYFIDMPWGVRKWTELM